MPTTAHNYGYTCPPLLITTEYTCPHLFITTEYMPTTVQNLHILSALIVLVCTVALYCNYIFIFLLQIAAGVPAPLHRGYQLPVILHQVQFLSLLFHISSLGTKNWFFSHYIYLLRRFRSLQISQAEIKQCSNFFAMHIAILVMLWTNRIV